MVQSLGKTTIDGTEYNVSGQVGRADSKGLEVSFTGYVPEEGRNVRFSATFNL